MSNVKLNATLKLRHTLIRRGSSL